MSATLYGNAVKELTNLLTTHPSVDQADLLKEHSLTVIKLYGSQATVERFLHKLGQGADPLAEYNAIVKAVRIAIKDFELARDRDLLSSQPEQPTVFPT